MKRSVGMMVKRKGGVNMNMAHVSPPIKKTGRRLIGVSLTKMKTDVGYR